MSRGLVRFVMLALLAIGLSTVGLPGVADAEPRKGGVSADDDGGRSSGSARKKKRRKKKRAKKARTVRYEVQKGDTLGEIAQAHGVRVEDIVKWNKLKNAHEIQIGQRLKIAVRDGRGSSSSSSSGSTTRTMTYVVRKGDTLGDIASKHNVKLDQLLKWNRSLRKNPDRLRIGQKIDIEVKVPRGKSSSVGRANKGKLHGAVRLPEGKGYVRRNSSRAWGTELSVEHIQNVMASYRSKFRKGPDFVIGDLSFEKGGKMKPHKSHQSGRDVDIGYVGADGKQLSKFQKMNEDTIDAKKNWYVIKEFLETGDVEYIFINYELQKPLYEAALADGYSKDKLEKIFQYPNGKRSYKAIVRHSRGHNGHMHVRFDCPRGDKACK